MRVSQTVTSKSAETVPRAPIQDEGELREFYEAIDNLRARLELEDRSHQFKAGQIRHCMPQGEEVTQNKDILKMVDEVDIESLESLLPPHKKQKPVFSQDQCRATDGETEELRRKELIVAGGRIHLPYICQTQER